MTACHVGLFKADIVLTDVSEKLVNSFAQWLVVCRWFAGLVYSTALRV